MSKLSAALDSASRAHRDVDVLLDRGMIGRRAELQDAVREARSAAAVAGESEDVPAERMGENPAGEARAALDAATKALAVFEREIAAAAVTIRVYELPYQEWRGVIAANPLPDKADRLPEDASNGFSVYGSVIDTVEKAGRIVDGDDEETPTAAEWERLWTVINRGDLIRLGDAVLMLNEREARQAVSGYLAAKKA